MGTKSTASLVLVVVCASQACTCGHSPLLTNPDSSDSASEGSDGGGLAEPDALADGYIGIPNGDAFVVVNTDAGIFRCYITPCQGKVYQCGNCIDDDGDGLIDSLDPDCLGACQNNERGFLGNIPGQNNAPCKADCYWDQDTGSGNDTCEWNHHCDPFEQAAPAGVNPEIGCSYDPGQHFPGGDSCADRLAAQPTTCATFCGPLTPNGCDCFGCCENPLNQGHYVYAGSVNQAGESTCNASPESLGDATKCKPCTPVPACQKRCDDCQLCFGKTSLPPICFPDAGGTPDGGVAGQCPDGQPACGLPGEPACAPGSYCVTGCCEFVIP